MFCWELWKKALKVVDNKVIIFVVLVAHTP